MKLYIGAVHIGVLAVSALACGDSGTEPVAFPDAATYTFEVGDGIIQTVMLDPASPFTGDTMSLRSTIQNAGDSTIQVSLKLCGLIFGGSLAFRDGFEVRCAGDSFHGAMNSGETAILLERLIIESDPGQYVLTMQHLLHPSLVASLTIVVQ